MWTCFMDMHSGGATKVPPYEKIYIEAPEREAEIIFLNRFGRNPHRVTCTCCGPDYSLTEAKSLGQASGYHRGCDWIGGEYVEKKSKYSREHMSISEYKKIKNVLVISKKDIKSDERIGEIKEEGYVWI